MFKGIRLSVRNLTIIFSLLSFSAIGSGIALGQGGGEPADPPFYGWKLESISYHGEDVLNVWKRNQAYQIVPVTYTKDWADGEWRENGQLIGNAEFVLPFSNDWATQMSISSSSEGYSVHRFKYYPAPGKSTPQKASFVVNVNAQALSSGHSEVENGFGDPGVGELPEWKSSHGKHLLERSVNSNGEATVITPLRRAFASASGYQAQVGTIARYAWVHQDPRRARIHIANFRGIQMDLRLHLPTGLSTLASRGISPLHGKSPYRTLLLSNRTSSILPRTS